MPQIASSNSKSPAVVAAVCLLLGIVVWLVFGQSVRHGFINYDDNDYVYENPHVSTGLTRPNVTWAFTHFHTSNWHPLTWMSHMLDAQLFGLQPAGHHALNVALHILNVVLLFLVLLAMTNSLGRSAFVAAIFAIHPLRVESVAWIAERKDLLSGLFFLLTLGAYAWYARRRSWLRYLAVILFFGLGLLAKPMLVTLPFVLLLLDFWPLRRLSGTDDRQRSTGQSSNLSLARLLLEKLPLLLLSIASCVVTVIAQQQALASFTRLPLLSRLANAIQSYLIYLGEFFWPRHLVPFYPYSQNVTWLGAVLLSSLLLLAITAAVIAFRRTRPWLLTGWFWYLGMLVPVIGLVQVGVQGHADRYTYLPEIGLALAAVWLLAELAESPPLLRRILPFAGAAALVALSVACWKQTSYWRDSETLWTHTLEVTPQNAIAHNGLGSAYLVQGSYDRAIEQFNDALALFPTFGEAQFNLANALLKKGDVAGSIAHLREAVKLRPSDARAHFNLANLLRRTNEPAAAAEQYAKAVALAPDDEAMHYNYANLLRETGRLADAINQYSDTLELNWHHADAHNNLALVLLDLGRVPEALAHFRFAIQENPKSPVYLNNMAWQLAASSLAFVRNGARAVDYANQANQLSGGNNLVVLHTLAAAYAESGQFSKAVKIAQDALDLAQAKGDDGTAEALRHEMALYQSGQPYHEPSMQKEL